jgi:SAM-dependent methyltransferase
MSKVKQHYERDGLVARIDDALTSAGFKDKKLTLADISALDQFHSRGLEATIELAADLKVDADSKVLDIGSGLGGPARYFANKFGCIVEGIDLTQSFVDTANYLTERTGFSAQVSFTCGSALELPYEDNRFDVAITQHVAMNVENREQFYSEAFRVLKPGGQIGLYDVIAAADGGEVYFPVPWAEGQATSFLITAENLREVLKNQGFEIVIWSDHTNATIEWFTELSKLQSAGAAQSTPPVALNIVIGSDFAVKTKNLKRNLQEGRLGILEAVARKPL